MKEKRVLIIGATSAIAEGLARIYADLKWRLFLVARNADRLEIMRDDLYFRGASVVDTFCMDANEKDKIAEMCKIVWSDADTVDVALIAHGTLPDQKRAQADLVYAQKEFRTNAESVILCMEALAAGFIKQGHGSLAVIGSVAGDRGRASNYLYGAAKSAVDVYASGLRARLFMHGVHLLTIKPGFVSTPMTAQLDLPVLLTATPAAVARDICKSIAKRKNILYTPWFWRWIMLIIRWLPEGLFKRLKF